MAKKTAILFTSTQYKFWLAAAKERYGHNMLDWPRHARAYRKNIEIVREVKINLCQPRIPYGNTGVASRENSGK